MSRPHVDQDLGKSNDPFVTIRLKKERVIRWVDIAAYAVIFLSGLFVLIAPPASIARNLDSGWVIGWAVLLMLSGGFGFIGRLTRFWAIEAPGAFAGAFGAAVYVLVLILATLEGQVTGAVASTFVACMSLLMVRRYVELQLFTTDPGDITFTERILTALQRRTKDSIASGPH